ncbi:MAG: SDR family oxidoreductase [Alphaproteobacteria bacterium]|nr:SDR family oxidoreductase [Alphaproteobacteria bacterium]
MYESLKGRVVLMTGGSRGLGRDMALALAAAGSKLAITGRSDSQSLKDAVAEIAAQSGRGSVLGLVADVRSMAECTRAVTRAIEHFGRVDVLVNNAGMGMRGISESYMEIPPRFYDADPAVWDEIIATNVNGMFYMARIAVPPMVARGFGKVINISTSTGVLTRKGLSPYGPSKAAMESLSRIWAVDLEGTGVDVNVFLPGAATDTDILPESRRRAGNMLPVSVMRPGILWLCADESNGMTGGRYVARLWDPKLPPAEAASRASEKLFA